MDAERVAALAHLVGQPTGHAEPPYVEFVTVDAIRHFSRAYGDGNPLYCDPEYAARSARGALVAPPLFPIATGSPAASSIDADAVDVAAVLGVAPPNAPAHDRWTLHRPIVVGTRLTRTTTIHGVAPVAVDGSSPPDAVDVTERTQYEAYGRRFATHDRVRRYAREPDPPPDQANRELASYLPDDLAAIERMYEMEARRGAVTRAAETVAVGDSLGEIVKGPLTVTDLITYRAGVGPGPLGAAALRLGSLSRRDRPGTWSANASGVPETLERRHWDVGYARALGYPSAYDYSHTRLTWFTHLLTNWCGDGGWVWRVEASVLAPNYVGDTHWVTGTVARVEIVDGVGAVDVELAARNQLDQVTCIGDAVVLLPTRQGTHVPPERIANFDR
jgi:acyl dehydratase